MDLAKSYSIWLLRWKRYLLPKKVLNLTEITFDPLNLDLTISHKYPDKLYLLAIIYKVRTFWEIHKIKKNLPRGFDKSADLLSKRQNHEEHFFQIMCASQKVRTLSKNRLWQLSIVYLWLQWWQVSLSWGSWLVTWSDFCDFVE